MSISFLLLQWHVCSLCTYVDKIQTSKQRSGWDTAKAYYLASCHPQLAPGGTGPYLAPLNFTDDLHEINFLLFSSLHLGAYLSGTVLCLSHDRRCIRLIDYYRRWIADPWFPTLLWRCSSHPFWYGFAITIRCPQYQYQIPHMHQCIGLPCKSRLIFDIQLVTALLTLITQWWFLVRDWIQYQLYTTLGIESDGKYYSPYVTAFYSTVDGDDV